MKELELQWVQDLSSPHFPGIKLDGSGCVRVTYEFGPGFLDLDVYADDLKLTDDEMLELGRALVVAIDEFATKKNRGKE